MTISHRLRRLLWRIGYDISRFDPTSHTLARRKKLLESYRIDTVLDVGANTGQFAMQMRKDLGFSGKIISFEPISAAFEVLKANAARDPEWSVVKCALGDVEAEDEINVAANVYSSSFLDMLPYHTKAAPRSQYIRRETVVIRTLDVIANDLSLMDANIYLKIDTQGYEEKVIKGSERTLVHINTIQIEMSLLPLYQKALLFADLHKVLSDKGYTLVSVEPGFCDKHTGQLLQIDGIYHRF